MKTNNLLLQGNCQADIVTATPFVSKLNRAFFKSMFLPSVYQFVWVPNKTAHTFPVVSLN